MSTASSPTVMSPLHRALGRTAFTRALHGEAVKVLTTRSLASALAVSAVVAVLASAALANMMIGEDPEPQWGAYGLVATAVPVLLVWAASVFFGELGNGVLRSTFIAVPRRGLVVLAKAVLAASIGAAAVVVLVAVCHGTTAAVLGETSSLTYLVTPAGLVTTGLLAFATACWSVISVSVAAITRNLAVSVGLVVSFYLFIESYLGSIPGMKWLVYVLPFSSGKALVPQVSGVELPHTGLAALGQVAVTAVLAGLAWWLTERRDTA